MSEQLRWAASRPILIVAFTWAMAIVFVPAPLRAQAPRIRTDLDTALVSVGDRMEFTVQVEHDPSASVVWPDSLTLGLVEVLGVEILPPAQEGGRTITRARFTLAAFELGDLEIPSFEMRVETPGGPSTTLSTDSYFITVQSVGLDEGGDIRAIRGPLGIPLSVIYLLPWILLLVLLGALGYWFWVKRKPAEAGPRRSVVIPRFPHEDALEALDRLEASDLVARGEIKEYHILVSEIIRTYVEDRFGVYALEMTTGEVVEGFRGVGADLSEDNIQAFEAFAGRCDLVKFAKLRPSPDACRDIIAMARAFVDVTQAHPQSKEHSQAQSGHVDPSAAPGAPPEEGAQHSRPDEALAAMPAPEQNHARTEGR